MIKLYGAPNSLYTGRARSYLIKAGIPYEEVAPNNAHYSAVVLPKAGRRMSMPTVELDSGAVIRDGAAIIDHFEEQNRGRFGTGDASLEVLSRLFDVIGAEGLLRPAMHYRWNFDAENKDFIMYHFRALMPPGVDRDSVATMAANQMRDATVRFGVTAETTDVVEHLYDDLLFALDKHLSEFPYLLGGRPSIADFGMIAPLYGHLGRDPYPLKLMREKGIHVYRWVERMNRIDPDCFEFPEHTSDLFPIDHIPDSLIEVLSTLAEDFVPETIAAAAQINAWLDDQPDLSSGSQVRRGVGQAAFKIRGVSISALAQPYRFYLLARVQEAFDAIPKSRRARITEILERANMTSILSARLNRGIRREANLEVWE